MWLTNKKKVLKAVIYRAFAVSVAGLVSLAITGSFFEASIITIIVEGIQTILYYLFDSLWDRGERVDSVS